MSRTRKTVIQTFKESDEFGLCEFIDVFKQKKGEQFDLEDITVDPLPDCCVCLDQYADDRHHEDLCSNKHPVCKKCLDKVLETSGKCPMCREVIKELNTPDELSDNDSDDYIALEDMQFMVDMAVMRSRLHEQMQNTVLSHRIFDEFLRFLLINRAFDLGSNDN